eukprot:Ihof_evm3s14 gene=Ihof_evmTU3s14
MFRKRLAFMDMKPPPGYVPGLGRGATGFTTRSDIGPARDPGEILAEQEKQRQIAAGQDEGEDKDEGDDEGDKKKDADDEHYDEEYGYSGSLFADATWDEDDDEADNIYEALDARMDSKRKEKRDQIVKEELEKLHKERPKLQTQLADAKAKLAEVTMEEWENIPEVGDVRAKRQKTKHSSRLERYTAATASMLEASKNMGAMVNSLDSQTMAGLTTPYGGTESTMTDLTTIGDARNSMLSVKLDQLSDNVSGQTVIDPKGYLTDLQSMTSVKAASEVGDIKKARLLLKQLINTNPKHGPGWIAAARLEEVAGKMSAARKIMMDATDECPKNEDVWLEAARLMTPDNAKSIVAQSLQKIPQSVRLWVKAVDLEVETRSKRRVIRKALDALPNSVRLWKMAVEMEDQENALVMLSRAVECCPQSVELWLALAHLENYKNARKVLNKARENIPTEKQIWITAAKLEEANGNVGMVDKIITRGVQSLAANGVEINRDQWIKSGEDCEHSGSILTAQSIIRAVISIGVEDQDRKHTWMEDADSCKSNNAHECARAIYAHALSVMPDKKSIWLRAAHHEKEQGTRESLEELLGRAVKYCRQAEVMWLMLAKSKWIAEDIEGARSTLASAFLSNPNSEQIWLAAVKLESENNENSRARILLKRARESANTEKVWMKSALFEWQMGDLKSAVSLATEGTDRFPDFAKLWMMRGQLHSAMGSLVEAREAFTRGLQRCPYSIPLWLLLAKLETKEGGETRARAILEKGRLKNPAVPELWLEAVRMEMRSGNKTQAMAVMAKALQECPKSGKLWAESIFMEGRAQRKTKSVDALKRCDNDAYVLLAVAYLFWSERKVSKAREWFGRALKVDSSIGDIWAAFYRFEVLHGSP